MIKKNGQVSEEKPSEPLTKYLAHNSQWSRREAETLIRAGRVSLNGEKAILGALCAPGDKVTVDGRPLHEESALVYIMLNKPIDFVSTSRGFGSESTVYDLVQLRQKLLIVGRLDKDSRGLLLLTNDGDLCAALTHPRYEHEKEYLVRIMPQRGADGRRPPLDLSGSKRSNLLRKLTSGIDIGEGDGVVRAKKAQSLSEDVFSVVLTQGRKRQIRRMFHALGYHVNDLKRLRLATLELGELLEGKWRYLTATEIGALKAETAGNIPLKKA